MTRWPTKTFTVFWIEVLDLINQTLNRFEQERLDFCSWKNNHELDLSLSGETDLDLLVDFGQKHSILAILEQLGYREAANKHIKFPGISHYYGLDENTGTIVHFHLYFRLVTGESHTKNYRFPYETEILANLVEGPSGVPVPSPEWQQVLFVLRHYIKISCLPGLLLFLRERESYIREFQAIERSAGEPNPVGENILGGSRFEDLVGAINLNRNYGGQILRGLRLRHRIRHLRRTSGFRVWVRRYQQIAYRLFNKLLLRQRKRLCGGGVLLGITGLDGTARAGRIFATDGSAYFSRSGPRIVDSLESWLGAKFDTRTIHLGKPRSSVMMLPANLFLSLYRVVGRRRLRPADDQAAVFTAQKTSLLAAARYLALAIDRYAAVRRAKRLVDRGFIVITDRYPSLSPGKMDSPRIVVAEGSGSLMKKLSAWETDLYRRMGEADLLLLLQVPVEVAVERNRARIKDDKESDAEIRWRHENNRDLDYGNSRVIVVDTGCEYSQTLRNVKRLIWNIL